MRGLLWSIMIISVLQAEESANMFTQGRISGELSMTYVDQNNEADVDTYGTAIGGILKYETAEVNHIQFGIGAYVSQKVAFLSGKNEKVNLDFFDENGKSYAYLGEAYVNYTNDNFSFRVGRQKIDTPLADTDQIRMHSNTFEAAVATYEPAEGMNIMGGYLKRWAGYDSGSDISKFKRFDGADSKGAMMIGVQNEQIEDLACQGWYYAIDNIADAFYADGMYTFKFDETKQLEVVGQYAHFTQDNSSGVDGDVYGIGANLTYDMLNLGFGYNHTYNETMTSLISGLGGGPYLTSMEEWTIDGMEDASAYLLSGSLNMDELGMQGLALTVLYGNFESVPMDQKIHETDFIATYALSETLNADASFASIHNNTHTGYDRFLVRLMYQF